MTLVGTPWYGTKLTQVMLTLFGMQQVRRIPPTHRQEVTQLLQNMRNKGVIQPRRMCICFQLTFTNHSSWILLPVICENGSCAVTGPGWSGTHYNSLCCVTRRELLAVVTFVQRSVYTCWAHYSSCGLTTVLSSASGISRNLKDSSLIGLRGYRSMTSWSNTTLCYCRRHSSADALFTLPCHQSS